LKHVVIKALGGSDFINGKIRWILKLNEENLKNEIIYNFTKEILSKVSNFRKKSPKLATQSFAETPHIFPEDRHFCDRKIIMPQLLSESRNFLTCGIIAEDCLVLAPHFQSRMEQMHIVSILSSTIHLVWVATICGKLKIDYRYSNTLGWNTFPVPPLTKKNKEDLTRCAEDILLAREAHFPATIADLYDPENMPENLREAHDRNDEVLERIYIGRRFKNDTERLEKLFELYVKMTEAPQKLEFNS
jgi:hypothetical protein